MIAIAIEKGLGNGNFGYTRSNGNLYYIFADGWKFTGHQAALRATYLESYGDPSRVIKCVVESAQRWNTAQCAHARSLANCAVRTDTTLLSGRFTVLVSPSIVLHVDSRQLASFGYARGLRSDGAGNTQRAVHINLSLHTLSRKRVDHQHKLLESRVSKTVRIETYTSLFGGNL